MTEQQVKNFELCQKYPFLLPSDCFGRSVRLDKDWDWSYTWYDDIPEGWKIAFGQDLIDEIREAALEEGVLDSLQIVDVKEKFGELRIYFEQYTDKIMEIVDKYTALSTGICIVCGQPDVRTTRGYIIPICYDCWASTRSEPTKTEYEKLTNPAEMPNEIRWRAYDKNLDKWVKRRRDISRTANMIRARFR